MATIRPTAGGTNSEEALLERYLRDIAVYAPLTEDEERMLSARAIAGDKEAQTALVNANLKFVVSVARQYASEGVSMLDLIAEGNIALLRAAERYDALRGKRFSTYAVWGIRAAMQAFCADKEGDMKHPNMDARHSGNKGAAASDDEAFYDGETLAAEIALLPEREQVVLRACFGIGQEALTMREIAMQHGMTRERVRQIRKRALRRLHTLKKQFA